MTNKAGLLARKLSLPHFFWAVLLLLQAASVARAVDHAINLAACPPFSDVQQIPVTLNAAVTDQIVVTGATGNVDWLVDEAPAPGCVLGSGVYTCSNGVTITQPPSGLSNVPAAEAWAIGGTPTSATPITFALEVGDGSSTCVRSFKIAFPYDLVFVLDRSGSMGSSTHIDTSVYPNRWDALVGGVNAFTPFLETSGCVGDRFGLTLFETNPLPNPLPSNMEDITAGLANDIDKILSAESPGGLTAMGAGLQDGIGKMNGDRPRVVLLFTDGEQNQDPRVKEDGTGYQGSGGGPINPGGAGSFKVVTVGIGNPSGAYHNTLQNLANLHGPGVYETTDGSNIGGLTTQLENAIQPVLNLCSPQMIASYDGTLSGTVSLAPFSLNQKVSQLHIRVSFGRKFETPQLVTLLAGMRILKDGNDITEYFQPMIVGNFTNSAMLTTRFVRPRAPLNPIQPEGSYVIELTEAPNIQPQLSFEVKPFADESRFDMRYQLDPASPRVGQPFTPTMTLSWRGEPVTNATVQATIARPGDDLGDLLARNAQNVDPSSAPDAGSPGHQKYLHLLENDPGFVQQLTPTDQSLTLAHQGGGVYSAPFDTGDISGIYQVAYHVSADDPSFGTVQRLASQSVYVRFGEIDLEASTVTTTVSGQTVTINLRPVATNGRFIGPAQGAAFVVDGVGLSLTSVTDHQDGSYTLVLDGDPDAPITISVLGDEIYQGAASDFRAAGLAAWLIGLIILLILLLLWVLRKVFAGSSP